MRKVPFTGDFSPLAGPIALVTTIDQDGHVNIAPKSWISHICRRPNLFVLGCSREHHTAKNLLANGECVLNFPSDGDARTAWDAHTYLDPAPDEPARRGFTPVPAERVAPPRLLECPAHIEGRAESVKWYGDECLFIIEEVARSADEAVANAPDPIALLRPIFYLGPDRYGVIEHSRPVSETDCWVRYVVNLIRRPETPRPLDLVKAHVAHLQRLEAAGRLILAGPFDDGGGGMAIIRADSMQEAEALAAADPFVLAGAYGFQVRKWHLSCEANKHMGIAE